MAAAMEIDSSLPEVDLAIKEVDCKIKEVDRKIKEVDRKIKEVEDQLKNEQDPKKEERLWQKEVLLREEKQQLRKEKEQMRKEKEQMRKEKEQLREEKLLLLKAAVPHGSVPEDLVVRLEEQLAKRQKFLVEAAVDRAWSKRQTTTSYAALGKQIMESGDYNVSASLEITSQFTDGSHVEAAMDYLLAVVGKKTLLDLALEEAAARDKEMDDKRSKNERYRKEGVGYDYIRGQELEVQLGLGRIAQILKEGSRKDNARYRMGCIVQDTSRSGVPGSSDKPDYALRTPDTGALSWSLVALVMELKYLLAKLYSECLGETTSRLVAMKRAQPNRKYAYAVLVCSQEIQVQKLDMADHKNQYSFSQRYAWSLNGGFGLRLLVGMLVADGRLLGFIPPPRVEGRVYVTETAYLDDMRIAAVKGDLEHGSPLLRGCLVYRGTLVEGDSSEDVAVKICSNMDTELSVLAMLTEKNVAGVLPVLHCGILENGDRYLVSRYCKQIMLDMQAEALVELAREVAMALGRLSVEGVVHGDVSIGNIVYETDAEGGIHPYLIDFGSAIMSGVPGKPAGTVVFAAVQTLADEKVCLSSDLESLFYVLVYVAVQGKAYWGKVLTHDDALGRKTSCFSLNTMFDKEVVGRCKVAGLLPVIRRLRDLFWRGGYKRNVGWEQFVQCLA